jgi:hypothetical protein
MSAEVLPTQLLLVQPNYYLIVLITHPFSPATHRYTVRRPAHPELGPHRPALCTMEAMMAGQFHEIHIHLRRTPLTELPNTDTELQLWLVEQFRRKNQMLEQFYSADETDDDFNGGMGEGRRLRSSVGTTVACALVWNSLLGLALFTSRGRRLYLASVVVGGIGGTALAAARLVLLQGRYR